MHEFADLEIAEREFDTRNRRQKATPSLPPELRFPLPDPVSNGQWAGAEKENERGGDARRRAYALDAPRRERLCLLISLGMSRRRAASYVGCHHATISRTAARDPQFARALRQAEEICEAEPLARVMMASRKTWRAAAWLLERTRPQIYGRGAGRSVPCGKAREGLEELAHRLCSLRPHDNQLWAEADVAVEQIAAEFAESAESPSTARRAVDSSKPDQSTGQARREMASRVDDGSEHSAHGKAAHPVVRETPHSAEFGAHFRHDSLPGLHVVR